MDLSIRTETFGQENQSWLGSQHGVDTARSITLDTSTFTANTHYPSGFLLSGLPLGKITTGGKYGPYDDAASDGRQTLVGFLLTAVRVNVADTTIDPQGALFMHGFVVAANLPVSVDANGKADIASRIYLV